MPTNLFDDLVDFINAGIDTPLSRFWSYLFDRFGSAKITQALYYSHTVFTLTLYIFFLGYPLALLRRLSLEPGYAPPAYQISGVGLLLAFSSVILPMLLFVSHRLRMQYKTEQTTRKAETYHEALRFALLEIEGIDLSSNTIESALLVANRALEPQLGPLTQLELLHAIFDDWHIPRTLSSGRQILGVHQRLVYLIHLCNQHRLSYRFGVRGAEPIQD